MTGIRLGFGYKARSGKDTAAEYLKKQYGGEIFKFAEPIYEIMKAAHKIAGIESYKDTKLLTWLGTDWGRSIDENIWINSCLKKIRHAEQQGCYLSCEPFIDNYYVTDVRFVNEAEALKNKNFYLIKINRTTSFQEERLQHISENSLNDYSKWDFEIDNNKDLESFYQQLQEIVQHIKTINKNNNK